MSSAENVNLFFNFEYFDRQCQNNVPPQALHRGVETVTRKGTYAQVRRRAVEDESGGGEKSAAATGGGLV